MYTNINAAPNNISIIVHNKTGRRINNDLVMMNSVTAVVVLSALAYYQLCLLPYHHILVVIDRKSSH